MDVCNTEQSSKHVVIQDMSQFGQKCTVTFLCYCGGDKPVIECDQISLKEI